MFTIRHAGSPPTAGPEAGIYFKIKSLNNNTFYKLHNQELK